MVKKQVSIEKPLPHAGARPAISFFRNGTMETCLTYGRLESDIQKFSGILAGREISRSGRVVLLLEKSLFFVVAHLAVLRIGAVCVPLNPGFKTEELAYLLSDSNPALVIAEMQMAEKVRRAAESVNTLLVDTRKPYPEHDCFKCTGEAAPKTGTTADDPALMIYTSGTTGVPKGALLSCANLNHDAATIIQAWQLSSSDTLCHALPLFHIHGLCFALHTLLLCGGHIVMTDRFTAPDILSRLTAKTALETITVFMAVPTMYTLLMDHIGKDSFDFSHIRLLTSGSAPLREQTFERITAVFGKAPVEREGMSETGMNFSNPLPGEGIRKPGSIGLPLEGVAVRVVDPETGRDLEKGMTGELWLKSPAIIKEYWNKPEQTQSAFEDGWFKTGDLGRVDANGYYYLTDRLKHLIITGGENVSARAVEAVIDSIDGVEESAVVGVPDVKWGEKVVAAVVADSRQLTGEDVIRFCKAKMQSYKCPKQVIFVDRLPRNTMGKIVKEQVKQWFENQS